MININDINSNDNNFKWLNKILNETIDIGKIGRKGSSNIKKNAFR